MNSGSRLGIQSKQFMNKQGLKYILYFRYLAKVYQTLNGRRLFGAIFEFMAGSRVEIPS